MFEEPDDPERDTMRELELFSMNCEVDKIIQALPDGTTSEKNIATLQKNGFSAEIDGEDIKVDFEELGLHTFSPRFIWSEQRLGFCDAVNTTTDHMCISEVENAIDSIEVAAYMAAQANNRKWKWILISAHHSMYSFMLSALTCGNPNNVLYYKRDTNDGIIRIDESGIWRSKKCCHPDICSAHIIGWEELNSAPDPGEIMPCKEAPKVIGFWTALARVMDGRHFMHRYCIDDDCALKLSDDQWRSIAFAVSVRNTLVHFEPTLHIFDVASLKHACVSLLEVIEFLAFLPLYISYDENGRGRERVKSALACLRENLS